MKKTGIVLILLLVVIFSGCIRSTGILQVKFTDAVFGVDSLILNISSIEVHNDEKGWIIASSSPKEVDLVAIKGITELMAEKEIDPGNYTQIRIRIESAKGIVQGKPIEILTSSKEIRFIHPFEIISGKVTSLLIDFDSDKSIIYASDKFILQPVVQLTTEFTGKEKEIKTEEKSHGKLYGTVE